WTTTSWPCAASWATIPGARAGFTPYAATGIGWRAPTETDLPPTKATWPTAILFGERSPGERNPRRMAMTRSLASRLLRSCLVAGALVAARPSLAAQPAPNQKLLDLMAQGKAETDLCHYDAAIRALSAVSD